MKYWIAPNGLHIEMGELEDAAQMAELHSGSFYRGWPEDDFAAYLSEPWDTPVYIACDKQRRIAGYAVFRLALDEAELLSIVVAPKWRRKGVGAALMHAALDDLRTTPARLLFLEVEDGNTGALSLYRRLGFAQIASRQGYYKKPDGSGATALVMRRELV